MSLITKVSFDEDGSPSTEEASITDLVDEEIAFQRMQDRFDELEIIDSDHPFSQGTRVFLLTDSRYVRAIRRATPTEMGAHATPHAGCFSVSDDGKYLWIIINDFDTTSVSRLFELIAHEVCHLVDHWFNQCAVKVVDPELRAYYTDWAVGKVSSAFELEPEQSNMFMGARHKELLL